MLAGAALVLSGCGIIKNGTTQVVQVRTTPPGATARILPAGTKITTPGEFEVERVKAHTIHVDLDGYCRETASLDRVSGAAIGGDFFLGGLVAGPILMSIDISSGAAYEIHPGSVDVFLRPIHEASLPSCDAPVAPAASALPAPAPGSSPSPGAAGE